MKIKETLRKMLLLQKISPLDAELLLSCAIQKPREYFFSHPEKELTKKQTEKIRKLASRRAKGEPVAYILGKKEFFGLKFAVNRNVLIPRPETELLVELAIKKILDTEYPAESPLRQSYSEASKARQRQRIPDSIIDMGTGSGNIIISLVKNIPAELRNYTNFYAVDVSQKALDVARRNAKRHKVDKYIGFIKSNLLNCIPEDKLGKEILIVANLPYVSQKIYGKSKQSLKYEPKTALLSPKSGLGHYIRLIGQIKRLRAIKPSLRIACCAEISPEQGKVLGKILRKELPSAKLKLAKDLAGKIRAAKIDKI